LRGNNFDGHDFIEEALKRGAISCVSEVYLKNVENYIKVKNTNRFLIDLANAERSLFEGKVVCITGSNGKTTTKEIISTLLNKVSKTHQTLGNQNNSIGVPLTFLGLNRDHKYLVIEIGTNTRGEIFELSSIVRPDVAIITNVALAHSAGLGSLEEIASEKGDILDSLNSGGVAILPRDSTFYQEWKERLGHKRAITFGIHPDSDFRIGDIHVDIRKSLTNFKLLHQGDIISCKINAIGGHNALNSGAALSSLYALGLDIVRAASSLNDVLFPYRRLTVYSGIKDSILVDDTYNANPDSVKSALDEVSKIKNLKKLFIAGQMEELGSKSIECHKEVIKYSEQRVDEIWCVGSLWEEAMEETTLNKRWFRNNNDLIDYALDNIDANYLVLLKGSRSSKIDMIADKLKKS